MPCVYDVKLFRRTAGLSSCLLCLFWPASSFRVLSRSEKSSYVALVPKARRSCPFVGLRSELFPRCAIDRQRYTECVETLRELRGHTVLGH
jgi:hypothetical protein